jgi:hypothetical protein
VGVQASGNGAVGGGLVGGDDGVVHGLDPIADDYNSIVAILTVIGC